MSIVYDHRIANETARNGWFDTILALVVPPVSVWRMTGFSREFWLNLAMTVTAYFPGVMHAVWISERESATQH